MNHSPISNPVWEVLKSLPPELFVYAIVGGLLAGCVIGWALRRWHPRGSKR